MHEQSPSHINSKIAQVILLQKQSMRDILEALEKVQEVRQQHAEANGEILKLVIATVIFLGKQDLTFHGHRELLANDPSVRTGNFLKTLKYLEN